MAEANGNQTNGSAAAETNGANGANGSIKKPVVDMAVALTANNLSAVPELAKGISSLSAAAADGSEQARLDLVEKARQLVRSLETPRETMIKHCWAQPAVFTALTVAVDTGLFTALAGDGGSPKTAQDLAKTLRIDTPLLCRLMRHAAAMGYIDEVGPDTYKSTNFSNSLTIPEIGAGYPCISGALIASLSKFPEYTMQAGYKTPNSISDGSLQYAYNTKLNMFEHLHANPPYGPQFNNHMGAYRQGRPSWMDKGFYPVQERLLDGFVEAPDAALLVDIGGGLGHDLDEFRRKMPDLPGRLVLQDLGNVLGEIVALDSKIERMAYDFHTEQPVKGARAYYMHSVLHDWPDEVAANIIARIKEAMKPGYSRLLINENVIPPEKAQWEATALDIMMLTLLSSRERTQADWEHLLQELGGLRINKIYTAANGVESIIECELVE